MGKGTRGKVLNWTVCSLNHAYTCTTRNLSSSTNFVFLGRSENQDGSPDFWLADIFDFSSDTVERISNETSQEARIPRPLPSCVFRADWKTRMATLASACWDILEISSTTAEWNSTKLGRKRDPNPLPSLCFWADRNPRQQPGLWLAETFPISSLKLLNGIWRNLIGIKHSIFF